MLEPDSFQKDMTKNRRNPRPLSLIPDLDAPPLVSRWFHAIDNPITIPMSTRRTRSSSTSNKTAPATQPKSPPAKTKPSSKWIPFSERDSAALEKAYQDHDVRATVPVNEDHLFEVDVTQRVISPIYWEGPSYEVRRATWFIQTDGWIPCEENIAEQIELGYYKHKPYDTTTAAVTTTISNTFNSEEDTPTTETAAEEKKLEMTLSKQPVDKQWNLLGPYLGQYIVYTGKDTAWLLSNSASSKFAKSIITRLTNKHNLGGTRLIRGYPQIEELSKKAKSNSNNKNTTATSSATPVAVPLDDLSDSSNPSSDDETQPQQQERHKMERNEARDYDNENSEEEVRKIDHLMFVIHGIGQKMSERSGQTFVHDVNVMRKTLKVAYPVAMPANKPNGIQVLPIMWRQDIKFGMAADDEEGFEADLGTMGVEDGCPTLDELTLDGVPNIRTVVSDVLMDVPLYMTPRYRELMTQIIAKEINRVYCLFGERNPEFLEKGGKVSIFGHSLGSLLAFDMLTLQPTQPLPSSCDPSNRQKLSEDHPIPTTTTTSKLSASDKKLPPLLFPVQNFFAAGSPLGVILLLRGFKIASRKSLGQSATHSALSDVKFPSPSSINFCYPAVENLYNIFHKSDPVAYRLEPLIARHYSAKLKPEPIPYMKGGLKGVLDASYNVGSGIANRAGAMYESLKVGLTTNLFMRGLGLSRQQIYEDLHPTTAGNNAVSSTNNKTFDKDDEEDIRTSLEALDDSARLTRTRSNSDPSLAFSNFRYNNNSDDEIKISTKSNGTRTNKGKKSNNSSTRKPPPLPLSTNNTTPYSLGAKKLKMLNMTGRVDYCIQEGLLENPYLSAFSAHMQYWQDLDVAAFIIKQIYEQV